MIKIAVVDDEAVMVTFIHKKIESILNKLKTEFEIFDFTDGGSALQNIMLGQFDLVFLDIDMPDVSGMDIANLIRQHNCIVEIIFITNKEDFVFDAIKYAPFRFIRKKRFDKEIYEALTNYLDKQSENESIYLFDSAEGKVPVKLVRIRYVEVSSHKLFINEVNRSFTVNGNLNDVEEMFHNFGFIKIHRSFLVNYRFVELIRRNEVVLDNKAVLPLSRSQYENVKIEYMRLSRGNG